MRIALIADTYAPRRSSSAVQMRDLAVEFVRQGHQPYVLVPSADIDQNWLHEHMDGVDVIRLKSPQTKDVNYVRRTLAEWIMPFLMLRNLRKSPFADLRWDCVVWYSPSIFLTPLVHALKRSSACRAYLVIRDIFPEWAVDMGLMSKGLPYQVLKIIERNQYKVADVIGVQTEANRPYFDAWAHQPGRKIEVLQNWFSPSPNMGCSIEVEKSSLSGRKIFVYAGNMGAAQGMDVLLDLVQRLNARKDVGFLFVGRGSESKRLKNEAIARNLDNIVFYDEIDPAEIAGLYAQCHVGLVALDLRHKTHNIPGKFLSYMQSGLPVLAIINPGNDLERLIKSEDVGRVCTQPSVEVLQQLAEELLASSEKDGAIGQRCRGLSARLFSPSAAVKQIVDALGV